MNEPEPKSETICGYPVVYVKGGPPTPVPIFGQYVDSIPLEVNLETGELTIADDGYEYEIQMGCIARFPKEDQ